MRVTRLNKLSTAEVSVVESAANRRRFAMRKSEFDMKVSQEVLQAVVKTAAEGEPELIKQLQDAGKNEKQITASVLQYRVTKAFSDQLTAEDLAELQKAAGYKAKAKSKKSEEDDEEDEDEDPPIPGKKKAKKSDEEDDDEDMEKRKKTKKSANADDSALEEIRKSNDALRADLDKANKTIKSLVDASDKTVFVAKAASSFRDVPGSADEIGSVLKSVHDVSPEVGKKVEELLTRVNAGMAEASLLMKSLGNAGKVDSAPDSAWSQLNKMAEDMVQKSTDGKLSHAQAMDLVMKTDKGKALYAKYNEEHAAAIRERR